MAKVKIQGHSSGTGILTISSPDTDTNRTITLPDTTDTLAVNTDVNSKLPLAGGTMTGNLNVPNNSITAANIYVADDIVHSGDTDTYLSWNANNLTIYNGGTNNLYMDVGKTVFNEGGGGVDFRVEGTGNANALFVKGSNGNVGIGTNSPDTLLTVKGSSHQSINIRAEDGYNATLALAGASGNWYEAYVRYHTDTNDMSFANNGSEHLRIDSSGKIGIGGILPSVGFANLAGTGSNIGTGGMYWNASEASKYAAQFRNGSDPSWGISVRLGVAAPDSTDKYIDFIDDQGTVQASFTGTGHATAGLGIQTGGTTAITINESQKVGIGETSPLAELHVKRDDSGASVNSKNIFVVEDDDNTEMSILGGSSSVLALNFGHSGDADEARLEYNTTSGSQKLGLTSIKDIEYKVTNTNSTAGHHIFKSHNTEIMRIDGQHNRVGIGTTSPYGKFEVATLGASNNYSGNSAIRTGVTWDSEATTHTISYPDFCVGDTSTGMMIVHAKANGEHSGAKSGTLLLLWSKTHGESTSVSTLHSHDQKISSFSVSTSGNNIVVTTDSDCAITWHSLFGR